jgi:hypothetical protein
VKLEKNAILISTALSEAYGGEATESKVFFEWHKQFMSKSQMETMLITFFEIKGIVHFEFIPQGQTVNQTYVEILKWLREAVPRKGLNLGPTFGFSSSQDVLCQTVSGPNIDY